MTRFSCGKGLALSLDKDDEIIRRRIIQKYNFLQTDLAVVDAPVAGVLEQWFEKNKQRYMTPERVAFSHIFFSDKEGEEATKARARKVLAKLRRMHLTRAPELGDAFSGPVDVGGLPAPETTTFFGRSELSAQLFQLPVGQWSGPYRSAYGWHLIYVAEYFPSTLPSLAQAKDLVRRDYLVEQRRILDAHRFETLRGKYRVIDDGAGL